VAGNFCPHLQGSIHTQQTVPQYRSTAAAGAAASQFGYLIYIFVALYVLLSQSQFVATFNAGLWHAENRTLF